MTFGETISVVFASLAIISIVALLGYTLYVEFALERYWNNEFKAHNGTCYPVDKLGIVQQCGYTDDKLTVINSNSECYVNEEKVNCSDFPGDEHFCSDGICSMNGVCPGVSNKSMEDCIKEAVSRSK